ncbi:MAG: hypothetical protein MI922_22960, partial [Bacteroidales bacterium]|nr:hypothetical protein [Bacteroidales bacterium]
IHDDDTDETMFEVRTSEGRHQKRRTGNVVTQRTIEFDVNQESDEMLAFSSTSIEKSIEMKKAADRVKNIKRNYDKIRELGISNSQDKESIEELENQPAYMRKKVNIENVKHSSDKQVSKFSLEDDGDNGVRLSENNRYLHDNVD